MTAANLIFSQEPVAIRN